MNEEMKKLQVMVPADTHMWLRMEALRRRTSVKNLLTGILQDVKNRTQPEAPK